MGGASPSPTIQHSPSPPQYSPSQDNSIEMVALIAEEGQGGGGITFSHQSRINSRWFSKNISKTSVQEDKNDFPYFIVHICFRRT